MPFVTLGDLCDHLARYIGKDVSAAGAAAVRGSAQQAIRELQSHHNWSYYRDTGRIVTAASQTAGTVAYDHTGGTYERQLTLTGATWPAWAEFGSVMIANVFYDVAERKSATVVTLTESANPGADLAAGTAYTVFRETYPFPDDFGACGNMVVADQAAPLDFVDPMDLVTSRRTNSGPGRPRDFAIVSGQLRDGKMAARFWPPPDAAYQIDFDYRRRPAVATVLEDADGLATVSAGGVTVTGHGTSFAQRHVGCVVRLGRDPKVKPTGVGGTNPFTAERRVKSVESATSLTVEAAFADPAARVAHTLSSQVDVEPGAMETALYRVGEKHARLSTRMQAVGGEPTDLERALSAARDADSRYHGPRGVGRARTIRSINDYPRGEDV